MALPMPNSSQAFSDDQQISYKAFYWDTTTTAVKVGDAYSVTDQLTACGTGLEFALFDLYPTTFNPASKGDIEFALSRNSGVTEAVLGYDAEDNYRTGVIPLIYQYWGAGAPPGGSRPKQSLMKFSGYVNSAGLVSLLFAGQGTVAAYVTKVSDSSVTQLVFGAIKEPSPVVDFGTVDSSTITNEMGYRYASYNFSVGDKLEIYYWHNGEPWGGIACKVIPGTILPDGNFLANLRTAPVLGTSFMSKETSALMATVVPYIQQAEVRTSDGAVKELKLSVALTTGEEERGFRLDSFRDEYNLVDVQAGSNVTIRKGRVLHFQGGFKTPLEPTTNLVPVAQQRFVGWSTFVGSSVTLTQNQTIPGVTVGGATRIQATGGTNILKYYCAVGNVPNPSTLPMSLSVWVYNIGTAPVVVAANAMPGTMTVNPGESKWVNISASDTSDGLARQMQFRTVNIGDSLDFIAFQPQMEVLDHVTPFTSGVRTGEEMYPRFTGIIDDIFPDSNGESAVIQCRGFDGKLTNVFDENNPDRLAYHAFGYVLRERSAEPVFGIPAYDNWPLELAIADLCYKAGIDSLNLGLNPTISTVNYGKFRFYEATSGALYFGAPLFSARTLGNRAKMIPLERQPNYGNVAPLQKDYLPLDDSYLFKPELTQRLYDRVKTLTNQYGYDFYMDAEGQVVLTGRNNPIYFQYLTQNGTYGTFSGQQKVNISAVGGVYFEAQHSAGPWSKVVSGRFSRLDLYAGVGTRDNLNGGIVNVLVERTDGGGGWATVLSTIVDTSASTPEAFYYDDYVRSDGTNAAIFKLFSLPLDLYRVTLSSGGPSGGVADCLYRVNGLAVYERDPDQSYYTSGNSARVFSTLANMLRVESASSFTDLRNHVIVVGSRKATITDSAKLDNGNSSDDNNKEYEFNVAVSVDPFSIYDPASPNFVGAKRMTVVFDDKVNDSDFARWLARTILYRYRQPKSTAKFTHTVIPSMELRDAVFVVEERNRSVEHMLWVTGFTETWNTDEALSQVDAVSYPEIPSYQPREDIDIDALFVDPTDGKGEPAINVSVSYKNLYGQVVSNLDLWDATTIKNFVTKRRGDSKPMFSEAITNAATQKLSHVAIPETAYLAMNINHLSNTAAVLWSAQGYSMDRKRVLVNNPYRHFFYVSSWDAAQLPTLSFTFQEGDGTTGVYDKAYYNFPTGSPTSDTPRDSSAGTDQWYVNYDYLLPRSANNPYYDPYTSEIGNLVAVNFDLLVSGRVRVSLWDANLGAGYEVPVAWLTAPTNDPEQPEQHWTYMESGQGKTLYWDGVDNIGFWNTLQSADWSDTMKGAFGDKPMAVGAGFYAWNDRTVNQHTLIGDTSLTNFDVNNAPYFTIGKFGQFYVKIEVLNDDLVRKDLLATGIAEPRTVNSNALPNVGNWNTTGATYVWTHLGEPTQVAIRIQDWQGSGTWTINRVTTSTDWTAYSTPNADASIFAGRPVRMTFVPRARAGVMFEKTDRSLDNTKTSWKLSRQAHLKATIFDQHWRMSGQPWDLDPTYQVGSIEQKRLANRMYHNEDHTLEWEDSAWRTGDSLAAFEWVFDPTLFKKDWGKGISESLRYGDYEQLETLPGFDGQALGGTASGERAYMMYAYISYLFYFSAHGLDRSGRRQWCLNSWMNGTTKTGFIDRSKIVTPTWRTATNTTLPYAVVDYSPRGAETYLKRSVFARQWKESYWTSGSDARSVVNQFGITNAHQLKLVQPKIADFYPRRKVFVDQTNAKEDRWLRALSTDGSKANKLIHDKSSINNTSVSLAKRTLDIERSATGSQPLSTTFWMSPISFGSWDWSRLTVEEWHTPNPCRDFHPYWRYPYMPDAASRWTYEYSFQYSSNLEINPLDILSCAATQTHYTLRDPGAKEIWYGYAFSDVWADSHYASASQSDVEDLLYGYGPRVERTVEEQGGKQRGLTSDHIPWLFDYSREDNLDRFDQYRGVVSRAPYADRTGSEASDYRAGDKRRAASSQPVKPAGAYLLNVARYNFYTQAPVHKSIPKTLIHFVDAADDWFDIRFRHEYIWYSDHYFPVTEKGGSVYGYTKNEYTKALEWVGAPWWAKRTSVEAQLASTGATATFVDAPPDLSKLSYDPGAWTGWKDDIWVSSLPSYIPNNLWVTWNAYPVLRWQEIGTVSRRYLGDNGTDNAHGGFGAAYASAPTGSTTRIKVPWLHADTGDEAAYTRRQNIFDEHYAVMKMARLAVGPEVPESRGLITNLALPVRLKG